MKFLVAAYVVLWLLHAGYLWSLRLRQRTLNEEIDSLKSWADRQVQEKT